MYQIGTQANPMEIEEVAIDKSPLLARAMDVPNGARWDFWNRPIAAR